jgi:dATP/dGTP diphosphohydrolase
MEGRKDDKGKARLDLIAPELLFAIGEVLTYGADKYGERNWEKGMKWGRPYAACLRHLLAWWGGKGPTTKSFLFGELDHDTGWSHLWHAACCIMFLIAYEERGWWGDDRLVSVTVKAGETVTVEGPLQYAPD